jgi:hypothetical protein
VDQALPLAMRASSAAMLGMTAMRQWRFSPLSQPTKARDPELRVEPIRLRPPVLRRPQHARGK